LGKNPLNELPDACDLQGVLDHCGMFDDLTKVINGDLDVVDVVVVVV